MINQSNVIYHIGILTFKENNLQYKQTPKLFSLDAFYHIQ